MHPGLRSLIVDGSGTRAGGRGTGAGGRGTRAGGRGTRAGERGTGAGGRGTRAGGRGTGAGERGTGAGGRGTGAGGRGTGAGGRGTGAGERGVRSGGRCVRSVVQPIITGGRQPKARQTAKVRHLIWSCSPVCCKVHAHGCEQGLQAIGCLCIRPGPRNARPPHLKPAVGPPRPCVSWRLDLEQSRSRGVVYAAFRGASQYHGNTMACMLKQANVAPCYKGKRDDALAV
eukprot:364562-Chlamydomonas_euryale.AAC.12